MFKTKNVNLYHKLIGTVDRRLSALTLDKFLKAVNNQTKIRPKRLVLILNTGIKMTLIPSNFKEIKNSDALSFEVLGKYKLGKQLLTIISQFQFSDNKIFNAEFYSIKGFDKIAA